jgi:hypothetical protein
LKLQSRGESLAVELKERESLMLRLVSRLEVVEWEQLLSELRAVVVVVVVDVHLLR